METPEDCVHLTRTEGQLAAVIALAGGHWVPAKILVEALGLTPVGTAEERIVRAHITNLRRKVAGIEARPWRGYRMAADWPPISCRRLSLGRIRQRGQAHCQRFNQGVRL